MKILFMIMILVSALSANFKYKTHYLCVDSKEGEGLYVISPLLIVFGNDVLRNVSPNVFANKRQIVVLNTKANTIDTFFNKSFVRLECGEIVATK